MNPEIKLHPLNDGIDHINVYSKGRTKLGRFLTNVYDIKDEKDFIPTPFGKFKSIEALWFYLKLRNWVDDGVKETLKSMDAFSVREFYSRVKKIYEGSDKAEEFAKEQSTISGTVVFQEFIKDAITEKIYGNEIYKFELYQSTLPIVHYYWYGDITAPIEDNKVNVKSLDQYKWITDHIESIRNQLLSEN